jgi:cytidyltransferase-like protein
MMELQKKFHHTTSEGKNRTYTIPNARTMATAPNDASTNGIVETPTHRKSSGSSPKTNNNTKVKAGPEPLLLSRKEVDVLYDIIDVVRRALELLGVDYIVTGGSLLGAIRQHSILFCDDDIDIAIIDDDAHDPDKASVYDSVILPNLQSALDRVVASSGEQAPSQKTSSSQYVYQIKPWEGGDRIRSRRFNSVFLDLFVLRLYPTKQSFVSVIGQKRNGTAQPESYVNGILTTIRSCIAKQAPSSETEEEESHDDKYSDVFPCWQFATRKAIELWPKEVYRAATPTDSPQPPEDELVPLQRDLTFGPLTGVCGPHTPVALLKRAFGNDCFEVYYQSISHKQPQQAQKLPKPQPTETSQISNGNSNGTSGANSERVALPPKVSPGGTWEASPKVQLEDEHYLPMQPLARKRRRPTMHCKETLWSYLQRETIRERGVLTELELTRESSRRLVECQATEDQTDSSGNTTGRPRRTIYMDGVFDLFHIGHLEAIRQCAALGDRVILGVTGDSDAEGYKRLPIVPEGERTAMVAALREVDAVVCPCPLVVTEDFLERHGIDLVVHGFASEADAARQHEFFAIPMSLGKFQRIGYYQGLSTTDRIRRIREEQNENDEHQAESDGDGSKTATSPETEPNTESNTSKTKPLVKPQWFGATLAEATQYSSTIPTNPFPLTLRMAIEAHIEKARVRRREALRAIRIATGAEIYDSILESFRIKQENLKLSNFEIPESKAETVAHQKLVASLLASAGFPPDTDLSKLHKAPLVDGRTAKDRLLYALTQNHGPFQAAFDDFVRVFCVPRMMAALGSQNTNETGPTVTTEVCYYQAFPCLRIVQPGEFSIGPHSDVAYGHHPCSVNGYVSLAEPGVCSSGGAPASALFLESRPGAEDWHALFEGNHKSHTRLFAGALNLHWTTENLTERTRVTLDFRMIDGNVFDRLSDGGHQEGGQKDVFRATHGYYNRSRWVPREESGGSWILDASYAGETNGPDFRVGFPWTVKNWDKFWKKQTNHYR